MSIILIWFISYFIPVILVIILLLTIKKAKTGTIFRSVIIHLGLILSIILSQYFIIKNNLAFPFNVSITYLVVFILSIILSLIFLGYFGIYYTLSAFLQQLCMLSIAFILLRSLNLIIVVLLIIPIYAFAHLLQPKNYQIKLPLTLLFGLISILLFNKFQDIYLNATTHIIIGSLAISVSLSYPESQFYIKRLF